MKLATENRAIETDGGIRETIDFTITPDGKMFDMLSSGMYSYGKEAILRELGANAADSNKEAGKGDTQFLVSLPNTLSANLLIRDYGVGLSPDEIRTIYTNYGKSTKTGNNDSVGCFGLGSKTPFCYTDSFMVTAWKDGKKAIYSIYKNNDRIPVAELLLLEDSDGETGVEIKIPVQSQDFDTFRSLAEKIYQWFPVRPKVVGNSQFKYPPVISPGDERFTLVSDDYALYKERQGRSHIVMGGICYPMSDFGEVSGAFSTADTELMGHGVVLFMPIGSVTPNTNRETLKFDASTVETLKVRLSSIVDVIAQDAIDRVAKADTMWDARLLVKAYKDNPIIRATDVLSNKECLYNGKVVSPKIHFKRQGELKKPMIQVSRGMGQPPASVPSKVKITERIVCKTWSVQNGRVWGKYHAAERGVRTELNVHPDPIFFIDDLEKGLTSRMRYWLKSEYGMNDSSPMVYVLSAGLRENGHYMTEDDPEYGESDLNAFLLESGLSELKMIKTSTLEKPPRVVRDATAGPKTKSAKVMRFNDSLGRHNKQYRYWSDVDVDVEKESGVYVEAKRYKWKGEKRYTHFQTPDYMVTMVSLLKTMLGTDMPQVCGVRGSMLKRFQKNKNWVSLETYCAKVFKGYPAMYKKARKTQLFKHLSSYDKWSADFDGKLTGKNNAVSKIIKIVSDAKNMADSDQNAIVAIADRYKYIFSDYDIAIPRNISFTKEVEEVSELSLEVTRNYPLLGCIYSLHNNMNAVLDYISMVDEKLARDKRKKKRKQKKKNGRGN